MRKFRITVDGQAFDVLVEEVGVDASRVPAPTAAPQPAVVPPPPASPAAPPRPTSPAPPPAATPAAAAAPAAGEGHAVTAPLPGMLLDVKVKVGDKVKTGQIVAILEAMKMENEIPSPVDGEVVQVPIEPGSPVNQGDPLVVIR